MRIVGALLLLALLGSAGLGRKPGDERSTVAAVADGDTIELTSGARVRLVQIDTPELGGGECYSRAAARELRRLLPVGSPVRLEADPLLDRFDRNGRLLRYVRHRGINVNLELVRRGAATVWFYGGVRGRYASELLAAASRARRERRGLWGACRFRWNPYGPATTDAEVRSQPGACDGSYPGVCVPSPPPDLDCADIAASGFRVAGGDPHRFDGDRDGRGCE